MGVRVGQGERDSLSDTHTHSRCEKKVVWGGQGESFTCSSCLTISEGYFRVLWHWPTYHIPVPVTLDHIPHTGTFTPLGEIFAHNICEQHISAHKTCALES